MSFFGDLADAVRDAFGGGGRSAQRAGGAPERSIRPQARPSILRRGDELLATRDIPERGIQAGQTAAMPEFGAMSVQGLTSREAGNVMRNIQASERMAREGGMAARERGDRPEPEVAKGARPEPVPPAPPAVEPGAAKGARPTEEGAGESAAARARRLGLASMIATAPGGLLSAGEGTTRGRRSLMGGGMIR